MSERFRSRERLKTFAQIQEKIQVLGKHALHLDHAYDILGFYGQNMGRSAREQENLTEYGDIADSLDTEYRARVAQIDQALLDKQKRIPTSDRGGPDGTLPLALCYVDLLGAEQIGRRGSKIKTMKFRLKALKCGVPVVLDALKTPGAGGVYPRGAVACSNPRYWLEQGPPPIDDVATSLTLQASVRLQFPERKESVEFGLGELKDSLLVGSTQVNRYIDYMWDEYDSQTIELLEDVFSLRSIYRAGADPTHPIRGALDLTRT